jgi:hypothetical protein
LALFLKLDAVDAAAAGTAARNWLKAIGAIRIITLIFVGYEITITAIPTSFWLLWLGTLHIPSEVLLLADRTNLQRHIPLVG